MSLDFPNRSDWLKLRQVQPKSPRVLHVSARLIPVTNELGRVVSLQVERPGRTYRKANRVTRAPS